MLPSAARLRGPARLVGWLTGWSRRAKRVFMAATDVLLIPFALWCAVALRTDLWPAGDVQVIALSLVAHRSMLGRTYFQDGLLALSDLWLDQAKSRFSYTLKYRPQDGRAKQREDQVKHLIAIERISAARAHEALSAYDAWSSAAQTLRTGVPGVSTSPKKANRNSKNCARPPFRCMTMRSAG